MTAPEMNGPKVVEPGLSDGSTPLPLGRGLAVLPIQPAEMASPSVVKPFWLAVRSAMQSFSWPEIGLTPVQS